MKINFKYLLISVLFVTLFLSGIERVIFTNMASYPLWMVNDVIRQEPDIQALRDNCYEPIEVRMKKNGNFYRCGTFWPVTKITYFEKQK